jgi:hypothetical protein
MSDITEKATDKVEDAAAKVHEGVAALQDRLGPEASQAVESFAADAMQTAGGRVVDAAALRLADSKLGRKLDSAASRGIERVREFTKQHPFAVVVPLALAAGFIEIELGVGVLIGLGGVVLFVSRDGSTVRALASAGGKRALSAARRAYDRGRGLRGTRTHISNLVSPV